MHRTLLKTSSIMPEARGKIDRLIAPGELSWQNVYWSLFAVAGNTMLQPSGSICGFHPSLSFYLRSSPIVCIFATGALIIRFCFYAHHTGLLKSTRFVLIARKSRKGIETGSKHFEIPMILCFGVFAVGVGWSFIKLAASSGIPWSLSWACFYLVCILSSMVYIEYDGCQESTCFGVNNASNCAVQRTPSAPFDRAIR